MAGVNAKRPMIAAQDDSSGVSVYSSGAVMGPLAKSDVKYTYNDVELPGDGMIALSDHTPNGGTVDVETVSVTKAIEAYINGHTEESDGDVMTTSDDAPYVGYGFYGESTDNPGLPWKVVWLHKVKYKSGNDMMETRKPGETAKYQSPTFAGKIYPDAAGKIRTRKWFATEAEAIAWLNGQSQFVATAVEPTSSVASGTYTSAKSVVLSTAEDGGTIYYTDDGTLPTATNGTEYSTAISCAKPSNTCIKAVTVKSGKANSSPIELLIIVTA